MQLEPPESNRLKSVGAACAALLLLGGFTAGQFAAERNGGGFFDGSRSAQAADPPASPASVGSLPDFVDLAKRVGPTVVNIATTQTRQQRQQGGPGPFGNDPSNDFWERFFGGQLPKAPQRQRGLGSGFIISADGIIVTNHHVVDGAEKIVVTLADGKNQDAKVLGSDPKTDIAVLKVDAKDKLPVAALGDSDGLQVGEWVMAIGNPFGLDHSVTTGIVSAKGRNIGAGPYDSFIQTDASINPGNSGGPLVNLKGEVVGINSAIFSQSGGNIGIGFAIPSNLVKELLPQLRDTGKVVRGYLGVTVQKLTPEIASTMGLKDDKGALVADVVEGGPAARAGIKAGDTIVEFNGKPVENSSDLPILVARVAPGTKVPLKVMRDSKATTIPVEVGTLKDTEVVASAKGGDFGMTVQPVTPAIAESLGLDRAEGLVVSAVAPDSAADKAGLRRGDVITQINRKAVRTLDEFNREMESNKDGKSILLLVKREQKSLFLALKP